MKTLFAMLTTGAGAGVISAVSGEAPPEVAGGTLLGLALPFVSAACSIVAALILIQNRNRPTELLQPLVVEMRQTTATKDEVAKAKAFTAREAEKAASAMAVLAGKMESLRSEFSAMETRLSGEDEKRACTLHTRLNALDRENASNAATLAALGDDVRDLRARINP